MASWFARTISSTLDLDDPNQEDDDEQENDVGKEPQSDDDDNSSPLSPNRGVKEDLSELTKTVTRQFWGVASFLAPPATSSSDPPTDDPDGSEIIPGLRTDFAEIGGRFRSGISKLSDNMASVSEITSKMASNFLQLHSDDEDDDEKRQQGYDGAVGVTDVVVDFVADITMHPDTWLDFPLPDHEGDQGHFLANYSSLYVKYMISIGDVFAFRFFKLTFFLMYVKWKFVVLCCQYRVFCLLIAEI